MVCILLMIVFFMWMNWVQADKMSFLNDFSF